MKRFFNPTIILLMVILGASSILDGGFADPVARLLDTIYMLPAIIIGLSFHEFGHAVAAYKLGDSTPKLEGRVTVNPLAHIDMMGFFCLLLVGFGWGKPVMINPYNFKNPRRDELIVSLAGVTVNLIIAVLAAFIYVYLYMKQNLFFNENGWGDSIGMILQNLIVINLVLMVFNLLPIPPLDGFGVVTQVLNLKETELYYKIYNNGFPILMVMMIFNITGKILSPIVNFLYSGIMGLAIGIV